MARDISGEDPFYFERFLTAQAGIYQAACEELRAGQKRSHWMWYIFPQMKGLGISTASRVYGIGSITEARAYLTHPALGPRLVKTTGLVLAIRGRSLREIFGSPDDMKFRSSMTLFSRAHGPSSIFGKALDTFCGREPDKRTLELLGGD